MMETTEGPMEPLVVESLAESFECMMVETTDGFDKRIEDELDAVYPQAGEDLTDFQEKCRVSESKVLLCPRCNIVFDQKAAERSEADKKNAQKEENPVIPRFMFNKCGAPRRNEEYRRQFQHPRPKTFLPPSDIPQEKWVESVNQKGCKRPKWRVLDLEK